MPQSQHELDATVGGATANSYLTAADALLVLEVEPTKFQAFNAAGADDRDHYLINATHILDSYLDYLGAPATETQSLRWPRTGCYDKDGRAEPTDELPHELIHAVAALAYELSQNDILADNGSLDGFDSVSVGSIKLDLSEHKRKAIIPSYIRDVLAPFLKAGNKFSATVVRA